MSKPYTYATAYPRDEQWGKFLSWQDKVGPLPATHDGPCCGELGEAPRGDGVLVLFGCCRPSGHEGPHVADSRQRICAIWEDPS